MYIDGNQGGGKQWKIFFFFFLVAKPNFTFSQYQVKPFGLF